jgi:beta-glucosidase
MKLFKATLLFILILLSTTVAQLKVTEKNEKVIEALISKMTLEEKVGQMTQLTLGAFIEERKNESDELILNHKKLKEAILDYHIGSIINTGGAANSIEKWHEIISTIADISTKETRLKIPTMYGIDAIHGTNYTLNSTLFPQSITLAASRNRELARKVAEITAYETKASGIPWNFNPVLGIGRQPLWSRFFETYGESVFLVSEMGREHILGHQQNSISSDANVLACMKHYMGYSVPLNGQDRTPAWIPERQLREKFLPPFQKAVESGVLTVMINSSEINGIPVHSDYHILTEILKEELGFKGLVVSDWEDIKRLYDRDKVAKTPEEAVKMAVMAGIDMSMVPHDFTFYNYLVKLVKNGEVPISRIDDAVTRILRAKYATGLFDNAYPNKSLVEKFGGKEFAKVNLQAAEESIILLKNKNEILPISKNKKVMVTGPNADMLSVLNGGWSFTWQGNNESLYPKEKLTIREAVEEKIGKENVKYVEGITFEENVNIEKAIEESKNVDVIYLCLGEPTYCETPGNIDNLELPEIQLNYAKKLVATGKPVVLILTEGRPRVFHKISDEIDGILLAMLPGLEGGPAIANILFGDINPSGKLPFTYPNSVNKFTTYDYKPLEKFDVNIPTWEYPFGFGLSYTTFEYSNLELSKKELSSNDKLTISVTIKNVGNRKGKESVELYITDEVGSVSRPVKELKGFEKVELNSGESKNVTFTISTNDLSFIGRDNKRVVEAGKYEVTINKLKDNFLTK